MIGPTQRISDADYALLMSAAQDGDRGRVVSFLVQRYGYSYSEAEAWWETVVSAKAWTL